MKTNRLRDNFEMMIFSLIYWVNPELTTISISVCFSLTVTSVFFNSIAWKSLSKPHVRARRITSCFTMVMLVHMSNIEEFNQLTTNDGNWLSTHPIMQLKLLRTNTSITRSTIGRRTKFTMIWIILSLTSKRRLHPGIIIFCT